MRTRRRPNLRLTTTKTSTGATLRARFVMDDLWIEWVTKAILLTNAGVVVPFLTFILADHTKVGHGDDN